MNNWSLPDLLAGLNDDVEHRLAASRKAFAHPDVKGEASETVWVGLLQKYLPKRYKTASAHVVDSQGHFSDQIDVVVFDRQYSPFIFQFEGKKIIPAESVYAAFEAKQTVNAALVRYAQEKVASVRKLHRTSLPIPHAGGTHAPKQLTPILGGILALDSDWSPPLGTTLQKSLDADLKDGLLDLGCVAQQGWFSHNASNGEYDIKQGCGKPVTAFLFELIARLQASATVPMIDIRAYAKWL